MFNFLFGVVFGIIVATVGAQNTFHIIGKVFDTGVTSVQNAAKDAAK